MFKSARSRLRAAVFACAAALGLGAYAADYTGTDYAPWSYSAGCVVWRATSGQLFHKSTIADVAADSTIGSPYDLDTTGHPWQAFASNGGSNYTAPGLTLVFDEAGYNGSSDAQFAPLSFGGLWVKVLQADDTPYCITDSKTDNTDRTVELGAAGASTYFKFEKSFTFDRNSPTTVKGTATVDIDSGATFTINARANKGAVVESGNTLVLAGSGTLAVTGGLTIGGTLDISAASVPTISGDVTLSAGCTIVLPASAELNTAISIPVATTVTAGSIIWAKIGANDAVRVVPTVESGAITYLDTNVEFTYYSTDEYPTTIPDDGCIYNFVGGESANAATTFAGVTVNGILKTRGYVNLTDFTLNVGGTHEVVSETTTVTAAWNSTDNYGYVSGNITIDAGATYAVTQTDTINWANSGVQKINIYGTLALGTHRWSIMGVDHCVFNLYPGARITGTGDANGLLDLFATTSKLNCYAGSAGGDIYVEGLLKTRNANTPIWIAANTTLHLQGGLTGGGIAKSGAGTLALSGTIASTVANSSVTDGTFAFVDATGTALPLTVNANKSVTVSASSGVTIPLNVTMAGGASITVSGEGTVNGTVTMNALPGTTTDLTAASWAGTVSLAALSNPANVSVLTKLGSANSTLVLKGISSSAYIAASGNTTYTIACPIRLDGAVVIDNGSSGSTINLGKIFGTGSLTIAEWNGCSSIRYNLNAVDIDNYSGTLTLANNNLRTAGGTMTIGIGNLIKASAAVGSVVLPITTTAVDNTTGTIAYNFASGALNGTTTNLCYDTVSEVSGIFIAAAKIGTTGYATVQNAIDAIGNDPADEQLATISVVDANATIPDGYKVENGVISKDVVSTVTITVPAIDNTTVTVTAGGVAVSPTEEGGIQYEVADGAAIVVTYAAAAGYVIDGPATYEFTASEGSALKPTGTSAATAVASITANGTTTPYTSLQAAVDAVAQRGSRITLLANDTAGATVKASIMFYVNANGFTYGEIVAGANFILKVTPDQTIDNVSMTQYNCVPADIAVTVNNVTAYYTLSDMPVAVQDATDAGLGTTFKFLAGGANYQDTMSHYGFTYDAQTDVYTLTKSPVAAVYNGVVFIGNYFTLVDAVDATAEADIATVKLLADVTLDATVVVTNSLTLDLNGHDIAATDARALWIKAGAVSITGEGEISANATENSSFPDSSSVIRVGDSAVNANAASLAIGADVTVSSGHCYGITTFGKNTPGISLVVNGTVAVTGTASAISGNGSSGLASANITVNDGAVVSATADAGIYFPGTGTLSIAGGTITGPTAVYVKCGTVNVTGGTLTGTAAKAAYAYNGDGLNATGDALVIDTCGYPGNPATVSVSGGTFTSQNAEAVASYKKGDDAKYADDTVNEAATGFVSGGTFNTAVADTYCANEYEPKDNGDGTYGVREDKGWVYSAPGYWDYTGTWTEGAALGDDKVTISDGATYSNRTASAGQLVTVAMTLSFDDVNDDDSDFGDAKAAIRLAAGETDGTYQFQLYTSDGANKVWTNATVVGVAATKEVDYNFVIVLDLTNKIYTASVVSGTTTNALTIGENVTEIPFACQGEITPVQQIDFVGAGKVSSIEGSYETPEPPPAGFVEDEEVTLYGGKATLTEAQAEWLNACGDKSAVNAKIATMTEAAFNNAYLLNLNILNENYQDYEEGDFVVTDFRFDTKEDGEYVVVEVSLERNGAALDGGINGTLKLKGASQLGVGFEVKETYNLKFDGCDTETIEYKKDGTTLFYKPVIE